MSEELVRQVQERYGQIAEGRVRAPQKHEQQTDEVTAVAKLTWR